METQPFFVLMDDRQEQKGTNGYGYDKLTEDVF